MNERLTQNDPLLGAPRPAPPAQTASLPPGPQPASPQRPPAAPTSLTSNAALAGRSTPVLDKEHELRIGDEYKPSNSYAQPLDAQQTAWQKQWQGQQPAASSPNGAYLHRPEPVVDPVAQRAPYTRSPSAPAPAPRSTGRIRTFEQAQVELSARGVTWQRLDRDDTGGWKFICSIPTRQNRFISRTYEGQARDYLAAIEMVLAKIDQGR